MANSSVLQVGSTLIHPLRIVEKNKGKITSTGGSKLGFQPSYIAHQTWTNAATIDADGYSVSHAGAGAAGTTSMTLGGAYTTSGVGYSPDSYARNLIILVTHSSSIVAMSGVIAGTNKYGNVITEAWTVAATGTSTPYTSLKAFYTVTSITETILADASANTIIVGSGKAFGLDWPNLNIIPLAERQDLTTPTAGVMVAGIIGSATADNLGTYAPNATLNGALDFNVWYIIDDPTTISGAL